MNNPLPRISLFRPAPLTLEAMGEKSPIKATVKELVESVANTPGLNPHEERISSELVERILDAAETMGLPVVREAESVVEKAPHKTHINSSFVAPPADESGLYNKAITLDESQTAAVAELAKHQYGCLIGAAGTGKTTVQKYLIQQLMYGEGGIPAKFLDSVQGLNYAVVAFTGMAVQVIKSNLPDWMQSSAKTIHSLLEFAPEESISTKTGKPTRVFLPRRHNLFKLDHDVIIIDESSMLGMDLWKQLIAALKPGCRIYMTGDLNQLPPIIGQPIFAYALSKWPVCELTKVHRQKEAGANRIVEVAHEVLNGKMPTFDPTKNNPHWRVIGYQLDQNPQKASTQILSILDQLRKRHVDIEADPTTPLIYDPFRDRVMTAGNGFDNTQTSSMVQQAPLNESLSLLIQPPDREHPRYLIDAGRSVKKFAVGLRVMATKNEAPNEVNRVTNGTTGVIQSISANGEYSGNKDMFGIESEVIARAKSRIQAIKLNGLNAISNASFDDLDAIDLDDADGDADGLSSAKEVADGGGYSSHSVRVKFDNGAERTYVSKAGVESISLAFASTVAKCQGSQFETAIIICHHAQKGQLSREWLYTAITRATKRVIILYTDFGLRASISKQRIHGKSIAEKVERYRQMAEEGIKSAGFGPNVRVNVPLYIEDYDPDAPAFEYVR